jgi:hypothetical protein
MAQNTKKSQVSAANRGWKISIGDYRNILISYIKYPLDGKLDLSDFTTGDFYRLATLFEEHKRSSKFTSANGKCSFEFDRWYNLHVHFNHQPFNVVLELGTISKDEGKLLAELFIEASKL